MHCDVMAMSCYLLCPAIGWNVMSLRCYWLWGHVVWFKVWRCGGPRTALYYKVLLRYYSVLQSTMPVQLCSTTKYFASTGQPVLLCTTKRYSGSTLYYKVLQRTTPVLLCTTKYYASTTLYYKVLRQYYSSTGQYYSLLYKVLLQYYSSTEMFPPKERRFEHDPRIIRAWSEDNPRIKSSSRTRRFGDLPPAILETILYWKIQNFALRLSPRIAPNAALPRKVTLQLHQILPTQNESHQWSAWHMKRHFQCAEQVTSPSNCTKYCACHAKWTSSLIRVTYETSFPMRGASNTAPATQNESHQWSAWHMKRCK